MSTKRKPWNKGVMVGQKRPFKKNEVMKIKRILREEGRTFEELLFFVGIDTLLRAVDLLHLKVSDVLEEGEIKESFTVRQIKTGEPVTVVLMPETRRLLKKHIEKTELTEKDHIFRSHRKTPITSTHYRYLVKQWAKKAGLNPKHYSTHTIRRTKASFIYRQTKDLEKVRQALGHKSIISTQKYLGIERTEVIETLRKNRI